MKRKLEQTQDTTESGKDRDPEEISVRKRINFDDDSDDDEVIITSQAHKKRKLSAEMEELKVWMEEKFDAQKEQTQDLVKSVMANAERGKKNEHEISLIKNSIVNIERRLDGNPVPTTSYATAATTNRAATNIQETIPIPRAGSNPAERAAFLTSRKSLRIWPINGETYEEIMNATIEFFCQALGARKSELCIKNVTRVKSAPRGLAYKEVLVEFLDNYARDDILMRGPSLAGYRDISNRPTAGIRLDIPVHLMGSFKTLESFGFMLKKRHGEKFRKHIKFDEFSEKLYIQVGIKEDGTDTNWTDYYPEEAKKGLDKLNAKKGPRFDYLASPKPKPMETDALQGRSLQLRKSRLSNVTNSNGPPWTPPARKEDNVAGGTDRGAVWNPAERSGGDGKKTN